MKNNYSKDKGVFDSFDELCYEYPYFKDDKTPRFHIGQSYEKTPAKSLVCIKCKGAQFYVGKGSCFTAIKCVNCEWECCVHDG